MTAASTRNCNKISRWRAPSALRIPISRVLSVTVASITFMITTPPITRNTETTPIIAVAITPVRFFHRSMSVAESKIPKLSVSLGDRCRRARINARASSCVRSIHSAPRAWMFTQIVSCVPYILKYVWMGMYANFSRRAQLHSHAFRQLHVCAQRFVVVPRHFLVAPVRLHVLFHVRDNGKSRQQKYVRSKIGHPVGNIPIHPRNQSNHHNQRGNGKDNPQQHQEGTHLVRAQRLQRHADRLPQQHTAFHPFTPIRLFYD